MENTFLITKCMLRPNEGSSLKEDYDIVAGNPIIDYYESIESPSISMTITFIDIDQVIGRKGITGGEYIDLIVKTDDEDADDYKITADKQKLMLNYFRFHLSTQVHCLIHHLSLVLMVKHQVLNMVIYKSLVVQM